MGEHRKVVNLPSPLLDEQVQAGLRGDFKRGQEIADHLERVSPGCHRAAFNRAWYEMRQGRLNSGLKLLDRGRWERAFGDQPLPTSKPIYRDESLHGKHVLLCSEGGLGDEIINVRFAQNFAEKGAKVIVTADPSLRDVFARVPGVSAAVNHKAAADVYHDFWVPGMSAGHVLGVEYDTLPNAPYLRADPAYVAKWAPALERKFPEGAIKLGLRFYGNPQFEHEQFRRFPSTQLIDQVGARPWLNLQKEETDLPIQSWEDTLAILSHLDLVITSCTSVAHASAALGRRTWILIPILPYYLWALPGETSPWYKTVRLFRQVDFGTWDAPLAQIKVALEEFDRQGGRS